MSLPTPPAPPIPEAPTLPHAEELGRRSGRKGAHLQLPSALRRMPSGQRQAAAARAIAARKAPASQPGPVASVAAAAVSSRVQEKREEKQEARAETRRRSSAMDWIYGPQHYPAQVAPGAAAPTPEDATVWDSMTPEERMTRLNDLMLKEQRRKMLAEFRKRQRAADIKAATGDAS